MTMDFTNTATDNTPDQGCLFIHPFYMEILCALGFGLEPVSAAVKAQITHVELSGELASDDEQMKVSWVPEAALAPLERIAHHLISPRLNGQQCRLIRLVIPVLERFFIRTGKVDFEDDLVSKSAVDKSRQLLEQYLSPNACKIPVKIPIFFSLPENLSDTFSETIPQSIDQNFIEALRLSLAQEQLGNAIAALIDWEASCFVAQGRAGGFSLLQKAHNCFQQGQCEEILLVGVESYCDPNVLKFFDRTGRVKSGGSLDGFIPSEAASCVLLSKKVLSVPESELKSKRHQPSIRVYPPGIATEDGHLYSNAPYIGQGLSQAIMLAIQKSPLTVLKNPSSSEVQASENKQFQAGISQVWCSQNGERYWAKEWGVCWMRHNKYFSDPFQLNHPAEYFGDIGAAFVPVLLALASVGFSNLERSAHHSLLYASSDRGLRAAVLVASHCQ